MPQHECARGRSGSCQSGGLSGHLGPLPSRCSASSGPSVPSWNVLMVEARPRFHPLPQTAISCPCWSWSTGSPGSTRRRSADLQMFAGCFRNLTLHFRVRLHATTDHPAHKATLNRRQLGTTFVIQSLSHVLFSFMFSRSIVIMSSLVHEGVDRLTDR